MAHAITEISMEETTIVTIEKTAMISRIDKGREVTMSQIEEMEGPKREGKIKKLKEYPSDSVNPKEKG